MRNDFTFGSKSESCIVIGLDHITGPFLQLWGDVDIHPCALLIIDSAGIQIVQELEGPEGDPSIHLWGPAPTADPRQFIKFLSSSTVGCRFPEVMRGVHLIWHRFLSSYSAQNFRPNIDFDAASVIVRPLRRVWRMERPTDRDILMSLEGGNP